MVRYEVWDQLSGNIADMFPTLEEALDWIDDEPGYVVASRDEYGFIATFDSEGNMIHESDTLS